MKARGDPDLLRECSGRLLGQVVSRKAFAFMNVPTMIHFLSLNVISKKVGGPQIRKLTDLSNLLYLRIFRKCASLVFCDLRTQSFL
jgi:hypothetical protein